MEWIGKERRAERGKKIIGNEGERKIIREWRVKKRRIKIEKRKDAEKILNNILPSPKTFPGSLNFSPDHWSANKEVYLSMGSCQGVANQINSWLILWKLRLHFPHAIPFNWLEIVFQVDTWDYCQFANARFANSFCLGLSWLWLLTNISPLWRHWARHLPKWLDSSRVPEPDLSEPMTHQLGHVEASLGPASNVSSNTLTDPLPITELGWK